MWVRTGCKRKSSLFALLQETVVAAALHIYACRVLQRLIEHCGHRPELLALLEDLMVPGLCRDVGPSQPFLELRRTPPDNGDSIRVLLIIFLLYHYCTVWDPTNL